MSNNVTLAVVIVGVMLLSCSQSKDLRSGQSLREMLMSSKITFVSPYDIVWSSQDTMLALDRQNYVQKSRVDSFLVRYKIFNRRSSYLRGELYNEIVGNEYYINDSVSILIRIEPIQMSESELHHLDSIFARQTFKNVSILYYGVSTSSIRRAREEILTSRIDSVLKHGK